MPALSERQRAYLRSAAAPGAWVARIGGWVSVFDEDAVGPVRVASLRGAELLALIAASLLDGEGSPTLAGQRAGQRLQLLDELAAVTGPWCARLATSGERDIRVLVQEFDAALWELTWSTGA